MTKLVTLGLFVFAVALTTLAGTRDANAAGCYRIENASSAKITLSFIYKNGLVPQNGEISRQLNPGTWHRYCETYDSGTVVMLDQGKWSPAAPTFGISKPGTYKIVDKPKTTTGSKKAAKRRAKLARKGEGRFELLGYKEIKGCSDGFRIGWDCDEPAAEVKVRCLANDRVRNLVCTRNGSRCNVNEHEFFNGLTQKSLRNHCPAPEQTASVATTLSPT